MTKERYLELVDLYFDGVVYNNAIEWVPIGFYTASGVIVHELELDPDVEIHGRFNNRYYIVYDPDIRGLG